MDFSSSEFPFDLGRVCVGGGNSCVQYGKDEGHVFPKNLQLGVWMAYWHGDVKRPNVSTSKVEQTYRAKFSKEGFKISKIFQTIQISVLTFSTRLNRFVSWLFQWCRRPMLNAMHLVWCISTSWAKESAAGETHWPNTLYITFCTKNQISILPQKLKSTFYGCLYLKFWYCIIDIVTLSMHIFSLVFSFVWVPDP